MSNPELEALVDELIERNDARAFAIGNRILEIIELEENNENAD